MIKQRRYLIEHADGSVGVLWVVTYNDTGPTKRVLAPTQDRIEERVQRYERRLLDDPDTAHLAPVKGWRWMPDDEGALPPIEWHAAWRMHDDKPVVDMPAAREIHRERIRARREKLFAALTVEQERAMLDPEKLRAIEAKRQRLRDAPADPRIEAAQTPEELAAVDPLKEDPDDRAR